MPSPLSPQRSSSTPGPGQETPPEQQTPLFSPMLVDIKPADLSVLETKLSFHIEVLIQMITKYQS